MYKTTFTSSEMIKIVTLSEKSRQLFHFHHEICHLLNGTTHQNQHRNKRAKSTSNAEIDTFSRKPMQKKSKTFV